MQLSDYDVVVLLSILCMIPLYPNPGQEKNRTFTQQTGSHTHAHYHIILLYYFKPTTINTTYCTVVYDETIDKALNYDTIDIL